MLSDEEIKSKIHKTKLFEDYFKQDIIGYFDYLTKEQKNSLIEVLEAEGNIIKNFLLSLKDRENIDYMEIKRSIEKIENKNQKLKELKEKQIEEYEINDLLNILEIA